MTRWMVLGLLLASSSCASHGAKLAWAYPIPVPSDVRFELCTSATGDHCRVLTDVAPCPECGPSQVSAHVTADETRRLEEGHSLWLKACEHAVCSNAVELPAWPHTPERVGIDR